MSEEIENLTVKEICNYIATMNKLVNEGIIKFNKEKAYAEICIDEATIYLEKQNVQLQQENTQLKETILILNNQLEEVKINKTDFTQVNILEMKNTQLKSVLKEIRECIMNFLLTEEYIIVDGKAIANNYHKLLEKIEKGIGEDK